MRNLMTAFVVTLICIFAGAGSSANVQGISKCFRADWLQGERVVNLKINGTRVAGTFVVEKSGDGDETAPPETTYEFSGTRRGNTLVVAFAGNRLPDVAPSEMKSLIWMLVRRGDKELLRIKFRGRNYDTNKFEESIADFESCEAGYALLAKTAKRVQFARGTNSATLPVTFKAKSDKKSFWLNMKAGQRIEIEAPGCGITFFYPDKSEAEEPAIDTFSSDALTQSGDYLFVISPAPFVSKRSVNFKVTN